MMDATDFSSTRPYLIRAIYEWCSDNGLTPYLAVSVDSSVRVPLDFVRNQEIVLNVSMDATSALTLGNEFIEFKARFGGTPREISVPVERVMAIYAKENGQGMSFPISVERGVVTANLKLANATSDPAITTGRSLKPLPRTLVTVKLETRSDDSAHPEATPDPQPPKSGAKLKRVK